METTGFLNREDYKAMQNAQAREALECFSVEIEAGIISAADVIDAMTCTDAGLPFDLYHKWKVHQKARIEAVVGPMQKVHAPKLNMTMEALSGAQYEALRAHRQQERDILLSQSA